MSLKESETLELKTSTSELEEAVKSIVAILNKHGNGELYFGVTDNGKIVGQDIGSRTLRDVSKTLSEDIEPKIYPKVEEINLEGRSCIKVSFQGIAAPYFAKGRAYLRVGEEDRQVSARELEGLFEKKNKEVYRWDNKKCENATFSDISEQKVRRFVREAGLRFDSKESALRKLGLMENNIILNTAVLLFGKKPQEFFPNAKMRGAVFLNGGSILDMKDFEGDLFYLIEEAQKYVIQNIRIGERIEGLRRIDVPEIDAGALREAIINAFCHRDYNQYGSVDIAIYPNQVEIRSPGKLYGGLTVKRITQEHVSERRNELIAGLLHRIHMVERWGRGIEKILLAEPNTKFIEIGRQFKTVFPRKPTPQKTPQKTPQITELERRVLDEIERKPGISRNEIADVLNLSPETIKEYIERLKDKGVLRRVGPDKGGHWEVLREG